jgi:glucan biosynthesis protein
MSPALDRRGFLRCSAAAAALGVSASGARAAGEPPEWERLVEAARASAGAPWAGAGAAPVLRIGHAVFLGEEVRVAGDAGRFGIAAGIFAVGMGAGGPAERPSFRSLRAGGDADAATVYALLDAPSVAAAARLRLAAGGRAMRIEARLFFRTAVERLALAPSSALAGPASPTGAVREADRLVLATAAGTVSRRISEPSRPVLSRFPAENLRHFGLMLDPGAAPLGERPPSLIVAPSDAWGTGEIHLAEAPAADEFHDNVAVGFVPRRTFAAGASFAYRYALDWTAADAPRIA